MIAPLVNYDHGFHAGNPADVVKHAALSLVLRELVGRQDPIVYLDTHAGAGRYRLEDPAGEWSQGIAKLLSASARRRTPELSTYLAAVEDQGKGLVYPGSPALAQAILRPDDRLELFELNPRDLERLEACFSKPRDPRVEIHAEDGYTGLARLDVPEGARLVALIDPPFEDAGEWDAIDRSVERASKKRPGAVLLLWYPLKSGPPHEGRADELRASLEAAGVRGLSLELRLRGGLLKPRTDLPKVRGALVGTGLLMINAPSRAVAKLAAVIPELARSLAQPEQGRGWEASWSGWG